ncbi:hypothetical protein GCM10017673_06660 [Streptosporangium violaceochromogenes]|nr:hypothetical protein GCM10017673_06660 [Streptosporangium violaceochromogenes]
MAGLTLGRALVNQTARWTALAGALRAGSIASIVLPASSARPTATGPITVEAASMLTTVLRRTR